MPGWWDQIRPYSLGWVTARLPRGGLAGFVNVAWTEAIMPSCSIPRSPANISGRALLPRWSAMPCGTPRRAGCEWLHVNFGPHLAAFYLDACGFQSTPAGLIYLPEPRA